LKRALFVVPFVLQFALLDVVMRSAWDARAIVGLLESVVLWTVVAMLATTRARRGAAAIVAAAFFVAQIFVHRYYRVPLDVQVAASALHAWKDVQPLIVRSLPALLGAVAVAAAAGYTLLTLARIPRPSRFAIAPLALCGLFGPPMRNATPEIRAIHAFSALKKEPPQERVTSVPLPPLHADAAELPAILVILTESVRADDYGLATSPETAEATRGRVDFKEMRAVSSYTAVSLSAVLTARSQEGPRESILAAPNLFDFAKAVRDGSGRKAHVVYYSAQSEEVFETKDVRAAVDRFVTIETLLGHPLEDDEDIVRTSLDALVVDRFLADLPKMPRATVAVLHLIGTHAPYHFTEADARFAPWDRVVAWSRLASLRNAHRNSIVAQDHAIARAVRAFEQHAKGGPYLVAYTSDHGEAFGEHGAIHHGQNLYDEQVHVPAWVTGALVTPALADTGSKFVTHLDLLPTLLDAMGLWDNFAVRSARAKMAGRSLLRRLERGGPVAVTNCTGMFPCPVNTWGLFDADRKLVAQTWDGSWACLAIEPGIGEVTAPADDSGCARLREVSRTTFPRLPNGQPNR
jgi:hypothetical protein